MYIYYSAEKIMFLNMSKENTWVVCVSRLINSDIFPFTVPAEAADKAVWVVCPAQGRYHLSSDVLVTAVTLGPVEPLVVLSTDVLARVVEETRVHQITAAH